MLLNFLFSLLYIFFSFFLFNFFENFKTSFIPFFSLLIILILFTTKKEKQYKIFSIILSLIYIYSAFSIFSKYFIIPFALLIILWVKSYLIKNPKILFIFHIIYGFLLLFSISSLKEIDLQNFLISLHFSLPFSLSLIKNTLYFKENPSFPYGHFIPVLFGITGIVFIILRIYSFLILIPIFVLLSISIYATLYQPPYKTPYPLIYQICIFASMLLNYLGIKL